MDRVERDWWERASYERLSVAVRYRGKAGFWKTEKRGEEHFVDMISSIKLHMPAGDVQ